MFKTAKDLGQSSIAITDHASLGNLIEAWEASKKYGVKFIPGVEMYITPKGVKMGEMKRKHGSSNHLLLLAKNEEGLRNCIKMCSVGFTEGYFNGRSHIDRDFLEQHSSGIITTTGCMASEIVSPLSEMYEDPQNTEEYYIEQFDEALSWYYDVFGPDNLFFEYQEHGIDALSRANQLLIDRQAYYGCKSIATIDAHFSCHHEESLHDTLICVQLKKKKTDQKGMSFEGGDYYLLSEAEMEAKFSGYQFRDTPIQNTLIVEEQCNVDIGHFYSEDYIPKYDVPNITTDSAEILRQKVYSAASKLYEKIPTERIERELDVVISKGYQDYFLIISDFTDWAKENNIFFVARGSASGSVCCYCLGITFVEPLSNGLLFERFLDADREDYPDIDLDVPPNKRAEIFRFFENKYGQVAQIGNYSRLHARNALKDVARTYDFGPVYINNITKRMNGILGLEEYVEVGGEFFDEEIASVYNEDRIFREMYDEAIKLQSTIRGTGIHAAGILIWGGQDPLNEKVPLAWRKTKALITNGYTQFDMGHIEKIGGIKVDILGVQTLQVILDAIALIKKDLGIELDPFEIYKNLADGKEELGKAMETFKQGRTVGVFQLEKDYIARFLKQMAPDSLHDIDATIALNRPGPLAYIPEYIDRKNGKAEIQYYHEDVLPIFEDTYGIMVYQEQLMQLSRKMCSYTGPQANDLRKATAKKIQEKLDKHEQTFIDGGIANGYDPELMRHIWDDIQPFARYSFNRAHSAAYAAISAITAYLKHEFPLHYMVCLINNYDKPEKFGKFLMEIKSSGIKILPPSIFHSKEKSVIEGNAIRYGLEQLKYVGPKPVKVIMECQHNEKPKTVEELIEVYKFKSIGKKALESLAKVGCFDEYGYDRNWWIHNMADILKWARKSSERRGALKTEETEDVTTKERFAMERDVSKTLFNIFDDLGSRYAINRYASIQDSEDLPLDETAFYYGVISEVRTLMARNNKEMAFVTIEDETGFFNVTVFSNDWDKYKELLTVNTPVKLLVQSDEYNNRQTFILKNVEPIQDYSTMGWVKLNGRSDIDKLLQCEGNEFPVMIYFGGSQPKKSNKKVDFAKLKAAFGENCGIEEAV